MLLIIKYTFAYKVSFGAGFAGWSKTEIYPPIEDPDSPGLRVMSCGYYYSGSLGAG